MCVALCLCAAVFAVAHGCPLWLGVVRWWVLHVIVRCCRVPCTCVVVVLLLCVVGLFAGVVR